MALLNIAGKAKAEKWRDDFETLNQKTDGVLGKVYGCLDEIKNESTGSFVDELVTTAADMADATAEMIRAMDSIKSLVNNLISKLAEFVGKAVDDVVNTRKTAKSI